MIVSETTKYLLETFGDLRRKLQSEIETADEKDRPQLEAALRRTRRQERELRRCQ